MQSCTEVQYAQAVKAVKILKEHVGTLKTEKEVLQKALQVTNVRLSKKNAILQKQLDTAVLKNKTLTIEAPTARRENLGKVTCKNVSRWAEWIKAFASCKQLDQTQLKAAVVRLYKDLHSQSDKVKLAVQQLKHYPDLLRKHYPSGHRAREKKEAQVEFAQAMQKRWGHTTCLDLKYRNMLSREKYEQVRRGLSYKWKKAKWTRRSHNGVPFPVLSTRYRLEELVKEIKLETGLEPFSNGLGVRVDLREMIRINLLESIRVGLFYIDDNAECKQQHGQDPEVELVLDSANHHKGMKVTSAGFVFPHGSHHPMAPSNTHEHAHIEGGDGNNDMAKLGKAILDGVHIKHSSPFTLHTKHRLPVDILNLSTSS